jgi:hypothetical protein
MQDVLLELQRDLQHPRCTPASHPPPGHFHISTSTTVVTACVTALMLVASFTTRATTQAIILAALAAASTAVTSVTPRTRRCCLRCRGMPPKIDLGQYLRQGLLLDSKVGLLEFWKGNHEVRVNVELHDRHVIVGNSRVFVFVAHPMYRLLTEGAKG